MQTHAMPTIQTLQCIFILYLTPWCIVEYRLNACVLARDTEKVRRNFYVVFYIRVCEWVSNWVSVCMCVFVCVYDTTTHFGFPKDLNYPFHCGTLGLCISWFFAYLLCEEIAVNKTLRYLHTPNVYELSDFFFSICYNVYNTKRKHTHTHNMHWDPIYTENV